MSEKLSESDIYLGEKLRRWATFDIRRQSLNANLLGDFPVDKRYAGQIEQIHHQLRFDEGIQRSIAEFLKWKEISMLQKQECNKQKWYVWKIRDWQRKEKDHKLQE